MRKIKIGFLTIICLMLLLPLVRMNLEREVESEIDNRMLTEWDWYDGGKASSYTRNQVTAYRIGMIDSFVSDRIGFREGAISAYTKFNDKLFGVMVHPTYTYGKDGYVFFKMKKETVDYDFLDEFCAYIKRAQDYCEERGTAFVYCFNPGKIAVYSEYLPEGYTFDDGIHKAMHEKLEAYGINYVCNQELLIEKAKEEQVFNVKYDAGHWNDLGCFYGTNNILSKISESYPNVREHTLDDFIVTTEHRDTLPTSYFPISEDVPVFADRYEDSVDDVTETYALMRRNLKYRAIKIFENNASGAEELPVGMLFKGSYYGNREFFFESSFKECADVHNYENFINIDYYYNIFKPNVVILETADYTTSRNYFSVDAMKVKDLSPLLDVEEVKASNPVETGSTEYRETPKLLKLTEVESLNVEETDTLAIIQVPEPEKWKRAYLISGDEQFDFLKVEENVIRVDEVIEVDIIECAIKIDKYLQGKEEMLVYIEYE